MHLDHRKRHLTDRRRQRRIAARKSRRIEQRAVKALVVRLVQPVDHLAFDVRVEDLHRDIQFGCVLKDVLVVLVQRHGAENLGLRFAAHIHAGPLDNENFHGNASSDIKTGRTVGERPGLTSAANRGET